MTGPINILRSHLKANREHSAVTSANIANENVEGFTKKTTQFETMSSHGQAGGVKTAGVLRYVDQRLLKDIEDQRARVASLQERVVVNNDIQSFFGIKGQETAFYHTMNDLKESLNSLTVDPTITRKRDSTNAINRLAQQIQFMANKVQEMRTNVDQRLNNSVNTVNQIIERLRQINVALPQTDETDPKMLDFLDEQETLRNELSAYIELNYVKDGTSLYLGTNGWQSTLLHKDVRFNLQYTQINVAQPNVVLSPILINGTDVTAQLTRGSIRELHQLGNTTLQNMQAELDEMALQLREQINIIHAQGASTNAPGTLTSFTRLPNRLGAGVNPTGATEIIGNGFLRIGIIDYNTGDYVTTTAAPSQRYVADLDLTTLGATDIDGLATAINALVANNTDAVDAEISAVVNADGTISITQKGTGPGNPGQFGIVLGSVDGQAAPTIHLGDTYDAAESFNFQHFFGFNRVFQTNAAVHGDSSLGIAQRLEIRPDLLLNPQFLAPGRLISTATPNVAIPIANNRVMAVPQGDQQLSVQIQNLLVRNSVSFNTAGTIPAQVTSFLDYGNRIIANASNSAKIDDENLERQEQIYSSLSQKAHDLSGVEPLDEFMEMLKISTAQALTTSALKLVNQMDEALYRI